MLDFSVIDKISYLTPIGKIIPMAKGTYTSKVSVDFMYNPFECKAKK